MEQIIHDASELRKLIAEHPELPIVVLVNREIAADDCCDWWYANSVTCDVGIILDTELPFNNDKTYTDEDEFEEDLADYLYDEHEELDELNLEELVREKMKYYEPYWKKVIQIWCDN